MRRPMPSTLRPVRLLFGFALLLSAAAFQVSFLLANQDDSLEDDFKSTSAPGKRVFNSTCAGCHGLDGRGSDKAANIAGSAKVQHLSDAQVSSIISNGVPGTGMPAFHNLNHRQVREVVSYLRILQGKVEERKIPGNASHGKEIFLGKGECSACHAISGEGGFLGPDLSAYGSTLSAKAIRDAIIKSNRMVAPGYRSATITTQDGEPVEGVIRNEDNFSIQLQTKDGSYHFFQKSEVKAVDRLDRSLMPTDYGARLSPAELDDLVSYLMGGSTAAGDAQDKPQIHRKTEGIKR